MSKHGHARFLLQELELVLLLLVLALIIREVHDRAAVTRPLLPKQVFEVHLGQVLDHDLGGQPPCREPRDRRAWNVVWFLS